MLTGAPSIYPRELQCWEACLESSYMLKLPWSFNHDSVVTDVRAMVSNGRDRVKCWVEADPRDTKPYHSSKGDLLAPAAAGTCPVTPGVQLPEVTRAFQHQASLSSCCLCFIHHGNLSGSSRYVLESLVLPGSLLSGISRGESVQCYA